ncbi:MAG: PCRF domain-containing protein [Chlorobiaceae bacterium]|nr:PCRF domain-containing protein [Chlorobiaceae bacterium]
MNHKKKNCRKYATAWISYGGIFDVDERKDKIDDLEKITADPGFWNDQQEANRILKELAEHKSWTGAFEKLETAATTTGEELTIADELEDASFGEELIAAITAIENGIAAIEFRNMLSVKDDPGNAIITIHA